MSYTKTICIHREYFLKTRWYENLEVYTHYMSAKHDLKGDFKRHDGVLNEIIST